MASLSANRQPEQHDWKALLEELTRVKGRHANNRKDVLFKDIDPEAVVDFLTNSREVVHSRMIHGIFVAWVEQDIWWSTKTAIIELLLVRLWPTGRVSDVVDYLKQVAEERGAGYVNIGTGLTTPETELLLSRSLNKSGFIDASREFFLPL